LTEELLGVVMGERLLDKVLPNLSGPFSATDILADSLRFGEDFRSLGSMVKPFKKSNPYKDHQNLLGLR